MNAFTARDSGSESRVGTSSAALAPLVPLVVPAVVVGAVVTIAAQGSQLLVPAAELGVGFTWALRAAGALAVAAGAMGLLVQRKLLLAEVPDGPDPTAVAIRTAAVIMALVTLGALLNPPAVPADVESGATVPGLVERPAFGGGLGDGATQPATTRGGESQVRASSRLVDGESEPTALGDDVGFDRTLLRQMAGLLPKILMFVVLLLVFRALARSLSGPGEEPTPDGDAFDAPEAMIDPGEAEAGLEASLNEVVRYSDDPRGQVTKAYDRLLEVLANAGAQREPQEAPYEHLYRVLGPLGVGPAPLHRLAQIYVVAQFSGQAVTEQDRVDAVDALEASLSNLRQAHVTLEGSEADPLPAEIRS